MTPGDVDARPEPATEEVQAAQRRRLTEAWAHPPGWRILSSVNNTYIGLWYTALTLVFFLFGGALALLMRLQLAVPNNDLVGARTYAELFTMHGSVMMFLFAVPIFEAVSIMVLPQMLGARDLPFPRLSAFGFWAFALGGTFFCATIFFGVAPRGGWFMYPPLTSYLQDDVGADVWLLGFSFVEVSAIAAAVELVVGVLKCRPPGMRIHLIPLYAWYILVVAVMVIFAFPPLIAGTLLLEAERAFHWPFFDPHRGGDPVLWQHLFWLFGHPEVYIVFLPSIALIATMLPAFTRIEVVGYRWVVLSAVGTGFLSFGLWVHHMFTTGLPGISLGIFSAASMAVAIPTGIQIACFVATMWLGKVQWSVPMLFSAGSLAVFVLGGLTGVMVAMVPFDLQAHDTHFVVAHLHTVLLGGTVFPILGALWYWAPMILKKELNERAGRVAFGLVTIGFFVTFFPMHWTGLLGMPRRVFTYPSGLGLDPLNLVSSIGAFTLAAGVAVIAIEVLRPRRRPVVPARNPWGAPSLEWLEEMDTERLWGIRSIPEIDARAPLWSQPDLVRDVDEGRFYLPDAEEGLRETLVTSTVDARPVQVLRVAGPSWLPMFSAFGIGGLFIFSTFELYGLALASAGLGFVLILWWLWSGTAQIPAHPEKDVGLGLILPVYVSGPGSVGWWGVLITELAFLTAFLSLVFGYFFYWTAGDDFPPRGFPDPSPSWLFGGLAGVLAAWGLCALAVRMNRADSGRSTLASLAGAAACAGAGIVALALSPRGLDPTAHVYPAIVWVLAGWPAIKVGVGIIMLGYCFARRATGRMTARYDMDLHNVQLYWHFMAGTTALSVIVLAGFPWITR